MLFLSASILLLISFIFLMGTSKEKERDATEDNGGNVLLTGTSDTSENYNSSRALYIVITFGLIFQMLMPFLGQDRIEPISVKKHLLLQWTALAGAALMCLLHGYRTWREKSIVSLIICISSVVIIYSYASNIKFISSGNMAVFKTELFTKQNSINNFECSSDFFVVNISDKEIPSEWYCPKQSELSTFGEPNLVLLPFSDYSINSSEYTIGKSLELTTAIHSMLDSAMLKN